MPNHAKPWTPLSSVRPRSNWPMQALRDSPRCSSDLIYGSGYQAPARIGSGRARVGRSPSGEEDRNCPSRFHRSPEVEITRIQCAAAFSKSGNAVVRAAQFNSWRRRPLQIQRPHTPPGQLRTRRGPRSIPCFRSVEGSFGSRNRSSEVPDCGPGVFQPMIASE